MTGDRTTFPGTAAVTSGVIDSRPRAGTPRPRRPANPCCPWRTCASGSAAGAADQRRERPLLRVRPGKMMAIIGESGSGKSVSSRAVMGLLPPTADDQRARSVSTAARSSGSPTRSCAGSAAASIAMVFQDPTPVAEPDDADRRADHRSGTRAPDASTGRRRASRAVELLATRPAAGARAALPRVPAPALRRHAPAGHDRHRARRRAPAADRRRGDDGARRHHPGADHGTAGRPARAPGHGASS